MKIKVIFSLFLLVAITSVHAGLEVGYYNKKNCSQAEKIVREVVEDALGIPIYILGFPIYNVSVGPGLVRMLFHDCFVRGCDGSVLLGTPDDSWSEKSAPKNLGLRGFDIIDKAKQRLEKECANTVSCADILVFAARDASQKLNPLIKFDVAAGRLDSKKSFYDEVDDNLPPPEFNLEQLKKLYLSKGSITVEDLVVLSGAHTFGQSHCSSIKDRLYPEIDPTLDKGYGYYLRSKCSNANYIYDDNRVVDLDYATPDILDRQYYQNVRDRKTLFFADWSLLTSNETLTLVNEYADKPTNWAKDFGDSMKKLSEINVISDLTEGEIRKTCSKVNDK